MQQYTGMLAQLSHFCPVVLQQSNYLTQDASEGRKRNKWQIDLLIKSAVSAAAHVPVVLAKQTCVSPCDLVLRLAAQTANLIRRLRLHFYGEAAKRPT